MTDEEYIAGYEQAIAFLQDSINDKWHTKEELIEKLEDELEPA